MGKAQFYGVGIVNGKWVITFDGTMTRAEAVAERDRLNAAQPPQPPRDYHGVMGIGGIGIYAENEMPIVPSEQAMAQYEKLAAHACTCRRCGQTDVFDGAMFTTGGGNICDDCFA